MSSYDHSRRSSSSRDSSSRSSSSSSRGRPEICRDFKTFGTCPRGPTCPYIHSEDEKREVCRDFQRGSCPRGELCPFIHVYGNTERGEICRDFMRHKCKRTNCPYLHPAHSIHPTMLSPFAYTSIVPPSLPAQQAIAKGQRFAETISSDKNAVDGSRSSKRKREDGSQEDRENSASRSQTSVELESDNKSLREENVLFREENKVLREENVKFRADNLSLRKKIDELKGDGDYGMDLSMLEGHI